MIDNAALLAITPRTGANPAGEDLFGAAVPIAAPLGVRCFLDDVSNSQRWTLGATIADADQTLYLDKGDLAAAAPTVAVPKQGDLLTYQIDGEAQAAAQVIIVKDRNLGTISHWELFLKTQ